MDYSVAWKRPVRWTLGNVDEAFFALSTLLMQLKKTPPYISDPQELAHLEHLAASATIESALFAAPPLPEVKLTPVKLPRLAGWSAKNYRAFHLEYPSAVESGFPVNDTVHGYYLERTPDPGAPAVIYLHGWMEFEPGIGLRLPVSWAGKLEANILGLHLPFHFERTPAGTSSGELFITGNLPLMVKAVRQAVSDTRQALYWLQNRHPGATSKVAILGKSLGGLTGAMCLAAEPGFAAGLLAVPATGSRTSIWRSRYTSLIRRDLLRQGLDEATTARLLEGLAPDRFEPLIPPERILVFKASADRVCFPSDTDRFAARWGVPVIELPTGHLTATFGPRVRQAAGEHMKKYLFE